MSFPAKFKIGDHVRIARTNREAELPDGCYYAGEFDADMLGKEYILSEEHEYDADDNTWDLDVEYDGDYDSWVHEGALEYVKPLTKEDEDAAIASILKAVQKEDT